MRIGIYSGTFDPVHKGHIAFALEAAKVAQLDKVFFAPEMKPRRKENSTHVAHRITMLRLALRLHPKLDILELPDAHFTPRKTYARLRSYFPNDNLVLLMGEDLLMYMHTWPYVEHMLPHIEIAIGLRENHTKASIDKLITELPAQPQDYCIVQTSYSSISSMKVRQDLIKRRESKDIIKSVAKYAQAEWLYHDLSKPQR